MPCVIHIKWDTQALTCLGQPTSPSSALVRPACIPLYNLELLGFSPSLQLDLPLKVPADFQRLPALSPTSSGDTQPLTSLTLDNDEAAPEKLSGSQA